MQAMSVDSRVVAETPASDLAIVREMVSELENYIVNEDLYRTISVRLPTGDVRLQMTGGDLLTRLHRLDKERSRLSAQERAEMDALQQEAERIIYSLRTRFNQRLGRELKARTDALKWYLDEVAQNPAEGRANYPYEIRNRQRIEEIVKRLGAELPAETSATISALDRRLRGLSQGDRFVWDPSLEAVFPRQPYWYLYAGK